MSSDPLGLWSKQSSPSRSSCLNEYRSPSKGSVCPGTGHTEGLAAEEKPESPAYEKQREDSEAGLGDLGL